MEELYKEYIAMRLKNICCEEINKFMLANINITIFNYAKNMEYYMKTLEFDEMYNMSFETFNLVMTEER